MAIAVSVSYSHYYALSLTKVSSFDRYGMKFDCSFHTTLNRNSFTTYKCANNRKLQLGNTAKHNVLGVVVVRVRMHDGIMKG